MSERKPMSRRRFLSSLGTGSVVAVAGPMLSLESMAYAADACPGASELSEQDRQRRQGVQYTDQSPKKDQFCYNCQFYKPDQVEAKDCGGCTIIPGPVSCDGWCSAWTKRTGPDAACAGA